MKKGCIIVLVVLAVLLCVAIVGAFVAYKVADREFGVSKAPEVRHEQVCEPDTRVRLVIKPGLLAPFIAAYVPKDTGIPTGSFELKDIINQIAPREIALLLRSDMNTRKIFLTLFANEQRFGPFFEKAVNESDFFKQASQVNWTSKGFEIPERGSLSAKGYITIPEAVEKELLEIWPTQAKETPALIEGSHQAELVIDNRNGDILALAAAAVAAGGQDWETLRNGQEAQMAMGIIEAVRVARLSADMVDNDTANFNLRIEADEKSGPGLQFLISGVAMPWIKDFLKNEQGLLLEGEIKWDETQSAITGLYTLKGLEAFIKKQLEQ